jgi:hypothetical protein
MVRAAVSASQASLERPGSAPAPFSACPQAEPRPEAQKRTRHVCRARVRGCERGGGGGRAGGGGVHMRATAPNVRVYLGVGLKGCIGPAHLSRSLSFLHVVRTKGLSPGG